MKYQVLFYLKNSERVFYKCLLLQCDWFLRVNWAMFKFIGYKLLQFIFLKSGFEIFIDDNCCLVLVPTVFIRDLHFLYFPMIN